MCTPHTLIHTRRIQTTGCWKRFSCELPLPEPAAGRWTEVVVPGTPCGRKSNKMTLQQQIMQQIILKYKWIFLEIITVVVVDDDDVHQI